MTDVDPAYLHPEYRSTVTRAPSRVLLTMPEELHALAGPVFGEDAVATADADLTQGQAGEPLGERIIVTGRVLDDDGRPVPNALLEIWQANAAGRYAHDGDRHPAPLDPNFTGAGRTLTGADGSYRFVTVKPGAYPWRNHENAWRPAHIHFSVFGQALTQRLVTQMYFPGDPLFEHDPIFNSVRDPRARDLLVARFDLPTTEPEWALGYRWDIVLRSTPFESVRTPSQTVGPFFSLGLCGEPQHELPDGSVRVEGRVFDGEGAPVNDALLELWSPEHGFARAGTDAEGRFAFLVPEGARRFELLVFARGLLKPGVTRLYLVDEGAEDPTLVARREDGVLRFDVRLQGDDATAFFQL